MKPLVRVRTLLEEYKLDGLLIAKRNNFSWMTGGKENYVNNGIDEGVAYLYITPSEQYAIANNIEIPRIMDEELDELGYLPLDYNWYESLDQSEYAQRVQGKRVGTDSLRITGAEMIPLNAQLAEMRSVLDADQIDQYRWLAVQTTEAVEHVCRIVEPGWTEQEIRGEVAREAFRRTINPMIICIMTDERIFKYRHPIATSKKLEKYGVFSVCFEKYGLVSSCTRAVHFGELSGDLSRKMEKLARVDAEMIAGTLADVPYEQFFAKIKKLYEEAGYPGEWKLHYQGGPAGYSPREYHITPVSEGVMKVNQVFGWNPTITGTKSEDMTLLTQQGPELISMTGHWPMIDVNVQGNVWKRPAILVR